MSEIEKIMMSFEDYCSDSKGSSHRVQFQNLSARVSPTYICDLCDFSTMHQGNMLYHYQQVHNLIKDESEVMAVASRNEIDQRMEQNQAVGYSQGFKAVEVKDDLDWLTEGFKVVGGLKAEPEQNADFCKGCDMTFPNLSTFMNHQKFFCPFRL